MNASRQTVDINADLGEGFPHDAELLALVSSSSLACGQHAGDRATVLSTLESAVAHGVVVGAHPGFADRAGFGRIEQTATTDEIERLVLDQFAWLSELAAQVGTSLRFLKPHGALYNQGQRQSHVAEGLLRAARRLSVPILGQPGSVLTTQAARFNVRVILEGFPDRGYTPDGRLIARTEPGAVLHSAHEIGVQAVKLVTLGVETLCIHGDDRHAVENARAVCQALDRADVSVASVI